MLTVKDVLDRVEKIDQTTTKLYTMCSTGDDDVYDIATEAISFLSDYRHALLNMEVKE